MKTTKATEMVIRERNEQIHKHHHTIKKDTQFENGELLRIAQYLMFSNNDNYPPACWSKDYIQSLHFKSRIEQLSIAAAFIIAEIDRRIYLHEKGELPENKL